VKFQDRLTDFTISNLTEVVLLLEAKAEELEDMIADQIVHAWDCKCDYCQRKGYWVGRE